VTGLSLTPLDEHGKYYADHDNGFIFVSNNKKDDEGSLDALIHLVHHGLKPVIVNITKDCDGDLYLTPANKHTIEYAGCVFENSYSIDNKSHNIKCDANVLESAIQFMEFAVDVPSVFKYITVDNFTPENIGIFKRLVCDKDTIIEGVPGTSAIQVRLFSSFGKMTSILFTDFPKQAITKRELDDILLILHNIDRYRKMSEYIYTNNQTIHEAQIAYLITGEQLFDSQPNGKTDTEQSILLAKAIMANDVIYYDKNQNVLHFSGSSFKLSFREGSCGEGRGEHVFESDVSPGTIDKQKLINSLFSSVRHQHALDFISDKQRRL